MKRVNKENINKPEYFNKFFAEKGFKLYFDIPKVCLRADYLLKKFEGGRLLDITCGLSPCSVMATKVPNSEVYAIDFSDKLIESLQKQYPKIRYSVGDIHNLPYDDNYFDYAVMGEILEHTEEPDKIIKEAVRVLKPGKILAISTPFNDLCGGKCPTHLWSFDEKDIREMLEKYGEAEIKVVKGSYFAYIFGYLKKNEHRNNSSSSQRLYKVFTEIM